jgi:WG containing repeat
MNIKLLLFPLLLLLSFNGLCQKEEPIFFFRDHDSTRGGIKTTDGKVILPPIYKSLYYAAGQEIMDKHIFLIDSLKGADSMNYWYSMKAYDRHGNFMYVPYWIDNGPDDYVEGLRRVVKQGYMGFVDRFGREVIGADFNYINPFYRGYAIASRKCKYIKMRKEPGNCCGYKCKENILINHVGEIMYQLAEGDTMTRVTDALITAMNLPTTITAEEMKLVKALEQIPEVKKYEQDAKDLRNVVHPVISQKPDAVSNFYLIDFRPEQGGLLPYMSFLITADKKKIMFFTQRGEEITLEQWRSERGGY